jgi:hypothetical protein
LIKNADLSRVGALKALNDGNLAIGLDGFLAIYNMKTYKVDIKIKSSGVEFITQLKNNDLFYSEYSTSYEGPYIDDIVNSFLVELLDNDYNDKTSILPNNPRYNIAREYSYNILFVGKKDILQNDCQKVRIEKLEKINGKYEIVDFKNHEGMLDFILLTNDNLIVVLEKENIIFYSTNKFRFKKYDKISDNNIIFTRFNDKFLLIGTEQNVVFYDYKNFKIIKKIKSKYPVIKIYVDINKVLIGESNKKIYGKDDIKNKITEYEIDDNTNYKLVYNYNQPHKGEIKDIIKVNDGRMISCSVDYVKIWT